MRVDGCRVPTLAVGAIVGALAVLLAQFATQPTSADSATFSAAASGSRRSSGPPDPCTLTPGLPVVRVRTLVVGGGIAGQYHAYLRRNFISNPGPAGGTGLAVIEASNLPCGRIVDAQMAASTPAAPLILPGCAARINMATLPIERCLANRLNITMFCSPFEYEYAIRGTYTLSANDLAVRFGTGWFDMTAVNSVGDGDIGSAGWNFLRGKTMTNPATGQTVQTAAPSVCGNYPHFYAYASAQLNPSYMMYLAYVANAGFTGDYFSFGTNACGYLEYLDFAFAQSSFECYPRGGMSQLCTRMEAQSTAAGVNFYRETPAKCVSWDADRSVFTVTTPSRTFVADELLLTPPPQSLIDPRIAGPVIDQLRAQAQFSSVGNVTSLTISVQWSTPWYLPLLDANGEFSARLLDDQWGVARVELFNTPLGRALNGGRVTYSDYTFLSMYHSILTQSGPAAVVQEALRALRAFPPVTTRNLVVPDPIAWFVDEQPSAWHFPVGPTWFPSAAMRRWANAPMGAAVPLALASDAWIHNNSGWAEGTLSLALDAASRFDPINFPPATTYTNAVTCGINGSNPLPNENMPPFGPYTPVTITAAAPPPPPPPSPVPVPPAGLPSQAVGACSAACQCPTSLPAGTSCFCAPCAAAGGRSGEEFQEWGTRASTFMLGGGLKVAGVSEEAQRRQARGRAVYDCASCTTAAACNTFFSSLAAAGVPLTQCTCAGVNTTCPTAPTATSGKGSKKGLLGLLGLLGIIPVAVCLLVACAVVARRRRRTGAPMPIAMPMPMAMPVFGAQTALPMQVVPSVVLPPHFG